MPKRVKRSGLETIGKAPAKTQNAVEPELEIIRANITREVVAASGFVSIYTNDTQLQITPWDVRMIFGEITEPATKERPLVRVKSVAEVRMSPQHAKKIVQILARQLVGYERRFGVIPQPPD